MNLNKENLKKDTGTDRVYSDSSDRIVELFINSGCAWTGSGNCISVSFRRCNCICDQCSDEFFLKKSCFKIK